MTVAELVFCSHGADTAYYQGKVRPLPRMCVRRLQPPQSRRPWRQLLLEAISIRLIGPSVIPPMIGMTNVTDKSTQVLTRCNFVWQQEQVT